MTKSSKVWMGVKFAGIGALSKGMGMFNRDWGRQYLVREISKMPGIPAKMGQILELKFGQPAWNLSSGQALPIEWIKERIEQESPNFSKEILEISEDGMTASLGQVHWAKLTSGREVAIKVQFPGVGDQIHDQLDVLLGAMGLVPSGQKFGIDLEAYREFLREFFLHEIDYLMEAEGQIKFRNAWNAEGGVLVPEIFKEWCSPRVLVQSFESSSWLDSIARRDLEIRKEVGQSMARMALIGAFRLGLIHTDLHPRNWGYREDKNSLVLYDFGAVLRLDDTLRTALRELFFSNDCSPFSCLKRFEALGFDSNKLSPIMDRLPEIVDLLNEPFRHPGRWNPSEWKVGERLETLLGNEKWYFRVAGPPWFLFLMRGLYGAVKAVDRLKVDVDLRKILKEELALESPKPSSTSSLSPTSGYSLRVQVKEGSNLVVDLEMPVRVVEELELVIPPQVLEKLTSSGVDIFVVKRMAIQSGLAPQELFKTQSGNRSYRVWIQ